MEIQLARLYKALAHPVRLQILHILGHGEACVCHLIAILRRPQPYISQQLGVLREAGLVEDRREGQTVFYRLTSPKIQELTRLGQELLREQGMLAELPAVPEPPLDDCTCPVCTAHYQMML